MSSQANKHGIAMADFMLNKDYLIDDETALKYMRLPVQP